MPQPVPWRIALRPGALPSTYPGLWPWCIASHICPYAHARLTAVCVGVWPDPGTPVLTGHVLPGTPQWRACGPGVRIRCQARCACCWHLGACGHAGARSFCILCALMCVCAAKPGPQGACVLHGAWCRA